MPGFTIYKEGRRGTTRTERGAIWTFEVVLQYKKDPPAVLVPVAALVSVVRTLCWREQIQATQVLLPPDWAGYDARVK